MTWRLTRRSVGALLAAATMGLRSSAASAGIDELPEALLFAALDDPAKARTLGLLCLEALPAGQDAVKLTRAVLASVGSSALRSRAIFHRALARRIEQDFVDGAVIVADGWHLSLTEARLYALAALLHPQTRA